MFKIKKISQNEDDIGQLLQKTRQKKKISINKAAQELNISGNYLKAMEENRFNLLPKGIYGKKIFYEYAIFLNLNSKIISAACKKIKNQNEAKNLFLTEKLKKINFLSLPKTFKNLFIAAVLISSIVYFGYYIKNITTPPFLIINNLNDEALVEENFFVITGHTDKEAEVKINNQSVIINREGFFEIELSLNKGVNTIVISSKKKYSRENIITKKILVE